MEDYKNETIPTCKEKCDEDERCAFFFINSKRWCALYQSCDQKRKPTNSGYTFKRLKGNTLQLYFKCRKLEKKHYISNFSEN